MILLILFIRYPIVFALSRDKYKFPRHILAPKAFDFKASSDRCSVEALGDNVKNYDVTFAPENPFEQFVNSKVYCLLNKKFTNEMIFAGMIQCGDGDVDAVKEWCINHRHDSDDEISSILAKYLTGRLRELERRGGTISYPANPKSVTEKPCLEKSESSVEAAEPKVEYNDDATSTDPSDDLSASESDVSTPNVVSKESPKESSNRIVTVCCMNCVLEVERVKHKG